MFDKAREEYLTAIRLDPDFFEPNYNRGLLYQSVNRHDKAREQFLTVIRLKPNFSQINYNLGISCEALNRLDEAREQFQLAVKLIADADSHFHLGRVYYKMGQMEDARKELKGSTGYKSELQRGRSITRSFGTLKCRM